MSEVITENLGLWTSALLTKSSSGRGKNGKQEPCGIKKLRELILELAVRGKLVPQDPNDEPAGVLLEKITSEQARLIKDGRVKKQKELPTPNDGQKPFVLPKGWHWVALSQLGAFAGGKTPSKMKGAYWGGDIPWVTPKDMKVFQISDTEDHVTEAAISDGLELYEPKSVLFVVRSGILRRSFPVAITKVKCTVNQDLKVLSLFRKDLAPYVLLMMRGFERYILTNLTKTGMTVESVLFNEFASHHFMLPPLAEQHRIVAKVDELMALCDQLEQQQTNSLEAHQTLVETLLGTLTRAVSQQEAAEAWARIADHFDTLFTTEHSIDQLKQTILQLAVMGKLVPQDPNDEPASVLLAKIAKVKSRLVTEGRIKKSNPLPLISDNEKAFCLPHGWTWARWDEIALKIGDIDHKMPEEVQVGIPYVSPRDFLPNNQINLDGAKKISQEDFFRLASKIQPQRGDIIYPRYGTIGENRLVETDRDFLASYSCCVVKTMHGFIDPKYQFIFSISELVQEQAKEAENKTTQANVGIKSIQAYVVPLPPLTEQHRIVAKVDELVTLCDSLKARLADAQTTQIHLADAIVEQAVA